MALVEILEQNDIVVEVSTGAAGPKGDAGNTILSGSGAPSGGTGVDGDFYLDTSVSRLYGPKATTWGSGVSLVGATGATGNTGAQGPQGNAGAQGPTGNTGAQGPQGNTGSTGADGKTLRNGSGAPSNGLGFDGDFYINTAANLLYGPKASGAWPSGVSLVGPTGSQGPQGSTGSAATIALGSVFTGSAGSSVSITNSGTSGAAVFNFTIPRGDVGATGNTGSQGPQGNAGADGKTVLNGTGAPSNGTGANGDFYLNTAASTIYGPKAAGVWGSGTSLVGPTGAQGPMGTSTFALAQTTFTANGSQTAFSLTGSTTSNAQTVLVFLDGVMQIAGTDFTVSSGTVTFSTAPPNGVSINLLAASGGSQATPQQAIAYALIFG